MALQPSHEGRRVTRNYASSPSKSILALELYKPCLSVRRCKRFIKVISGVASFHVEERFDIIIFIMERTLDSSLWSLPQIVYYGVLDSLLLSSSQIVLCSPQKVYFIAHPRKFIMELTLSLLSLLWSSSQLVYY